MPDFPPGDLRGDRDILLAFLRFQRDVILWKTEGLDTEALRTRSTVSTMTLAGLLKHSALVEIWWFEEVFMGHPTPPPYDRVDWDADPNWEWNTALTDDPDELRKGYRDAIDRADAIIAAADLDDVARGSSGWAGQPSLRWILQQVTCETARHAGHADLLRESIDGATGWRQPESVA